MKRKYASLLRIILICCLFFVGFKGNSRSFTYQGKEVLEDQPEGDLQYFYVDYQYYYKYQGSITSSSGNFILPMVFGENGKVYIRNLTDRSEKLWIEGIMEGDDLIFFPNSETLFHPISIVYYDQDPNVYLKLGRCNFDENKIEEDETIEQIIFSKTPDGGYRMNMPESTGILVKYPSRTTLKYNYTLSPSELKPVSPPRGYKEEDYQIDFIPFAQTYVPQYFDASQQEAAIRIKVVRTDKEFYVKGLNFLTGSADLWLKGNIVGNKVVFPHGAYMGIGNDGKAIYANVVEYDHPSDPSTEGHPHVTIKVTGLEEDLTFDYDPESGNLSNPSACWNLRSTPDDSWKMNLSIEDPVMLMIGAPDFYNNPQLKKIPENHRFRPLPPEVFHPWMSHMYEVRVSYLDAHGYMMDPYKMYVKQINSEDNTPVEMKVNNINNWEEEYSYLYPYGISYLSYIQAWGGVGTNIANNQSIYTDLDNGKTYHYELIYETDDETFSSINTGVNSIHVEAEENSPYYDLTGREINPNSMKSGIYIHNGKKIIVR